MPQSRVTTSGHFADTQSLTGDEPNLTNSQFVVAWADTKKNTHGMQSGSGPISSIPPWRSTRNFTEEANVHNYRNMLSEQHVYLPGARQTSLELPTSRLRIEQPKNMSERLVMKFLLQLHKLPTCLGRKCGKEWVLSKIKQRKTWTSHQVTLLNEMNSVAGDA